ncbi:glycosyltransferase [Streptomyces gilvus]|uniref:glycosyltransferase n=1 Tax=Streptomyces gilvus TaxID=2920937 RepID=UPI001F11721D|nr:glycosyltransferase [Streptomyces sp. CME 23]MCH5670853.1 glycosyltransferase [Streptomyces sp. CME 23]
MRILFTCVPGAAHFHAMLPLVRAAHTAGHTVAVATAETFGAAFTREGIELLPSGVDWSQSDPTSLPQFHQSSGPPIRAFAEVAGMGMVDDLVAHARTFEPDLMVWDAMEFGGWVAAELLGLPQAAAASAMGTPRPVMQAMAGDAIAALAAKYRLPEDPQLHRMFSHLYLHRKPRTLDLPYGERLAQEFRYRPDMFDAPAPPAPDWLKAADGPPLVHLSLGTTFVGTPGARAVHRTVLEALADEPVRLVVSTGRGADPAEYGSVPSNTRLVPYVDHRALLPRCAVFLSHGSFSSILVAIAAAVPLCFLPMGADQPVVSMHLANLGLGVNLANVYTPPAPSLDPATLTPDAVRKAVRTVIDDPGYAEAASLVRDDFRRLPPVSAVVERLEALAGG